MSRRTDRALTFRPARRRRMRGRVGVALAGVIAIGTLIATATSAASATRPASSSGAPGNCPTLKYPVVNFLAYVCGTSGAANPKLAPVQIGYINSQGGTEDIDDNATLAVNATEKFINQHLGGIDGHPVKLDECFTPETVSGSTGCGIAFADNKAITGVIVGTIIEVGDEAFEQALEPTHKLLIMFSGGPTDSPYKQALWLYGSGSSLEGPYPTFIAQHLHAKSAAIIYENTPGASATIDAVEEGFRLEHVAVHVASFPPTETDLTVPLEAADAAHVGAIFTTVSFSYCSDLYLALKQLSITTPVVSNPLCFSPSIATADGGKLPAWFYGNATPENVPSSTDPAVLAYDRFAREYGLVSTETDNWTEVTFSELLTLVRFMNQVGYDNLTSANITKQALSFRGPLEWGGASVVCGEYKAAPQVCSDEAQFYKPNSVGDLLKVGGWTLPPKGLPINAG